jgi:hypothetical protein
MAMIHTVGDLIDALERYPRNTSIRLLNSGVITGIEKVENFASRVSLISTRERRN